MGFLKKFFRNVFHDGAPALASSSFEDVSEVDLETHLGVERYGDFTLTGAVRPSYDLKIVPTLTMGDGEESPAILGAIIKSALRCEGWRDRPRPN